MAPWEGKDQASEQRGKELTSRVETSKKAMPMCGAAGSPGLYFPFWDISSSRGSRLFLFSASLFSPTLPFSHTCPSFQYLFHSQHKKKRHILHLTFTSLRLVPCVAAKRQIRKQGSDENKTSDDKHRTAKDTEQRQTTLKTGLATDGGLHTRHCSVVQRPISPRKPGLSSE